MERMEGEVVIIQPKTKSLLVPIVVFLFFTAILFTQNLLLERSLPSEKWSRSISFEAKTWNALPLIQQEDTKFHVYVPTENTLNWFVVNDGLQNIQKTDIPVKIPLLNPFWAKGNQVIYLDDKKNLTHFDGKSLTVLTEKVDGLSSYGNNILFWKENHVYTIHSDSFKIEPLFDTQRPINSIVMNANKLDSFLLVEEESPTLLNVLFYEKQADQYNRRSIIELSEYAGESVGEIRFALENNQLYLLYTMQTIRQGELNSYLYFGTMQTNQPIVKPEFKKLTIFEKNTGEELESPNDLQLTLRNQKPFLLFSANGDISAKKSGVNIYEAQLEQNQWLAEKRSKTEDLSIQPQWLNENAVLWLEFFGNKQYEVKGSSTHQDTIVQSQKLTAQDWNNALATTLIAISLSMIILFNAIIWIFPPAVYIIGLYLIKPRALEERPNRVTGIAIGLYLITQILFLPKLFKAFYYYAPGYLTFSYSFILIPLILGGLSFISTYFGRMKEWKAEQNILYFIGINLLLIILIIGPYLA